MSSLTVSSIVPLQQSSLSEKLCCVLQTLQNFMYTMLRDSNPLAAKISLDVMVELYKRNIWWVLFFTPDFFTVILIIFHFNLIVFLSGSQERCQNSQCHCNSVLLQGYKGRFSHISTNCFLYNISCSPVHTYLSSCLDCCCWSEVLPGQR